jgi:SUMO ligase MMS21 Smc5/6 complex component
VKLGFRRKRQFCCLILLAWSEVEFHINQIVVRESGLAYDDKKAEAVVGKRFEKKLDILKKKGVIFKDESDAIEKFQHFRNNLFHGKEPSFVTLGDKEIDAIMDNAVEAAQLALDIGLGWHGKRDKE